MDTFDASRKHDDSKSRQHAFPTTPRTDVFSKPASSPGHSPYPSAASNSAREARLQSSSPVPCLSPAHLPFVRIRIATSDIKTTDKGKEVVSFNIDVSLVLPYEVEPGTKMPPTSWRVEKTLADVVALDSAIRAHASRSERQTILSPPEKSLFKDHSPARSDQRKAVLEQYLQSLVAAPMRDKDALCHFFNTDLTRDRSAVNPASGEMEGWLTKKGRGFSGGWLVSPCLLITRS